jgi:hypothetical protein
MSQKTEGNSRGVTIREIENGTAELAPRRYSRLLSRDLQDELHSALDAAFDRALFSSLDVVVRELAKYSTNRRCAELIEFERRRRFERGSADAPSLRAAGD